MENAATFDSHETTGAAVQPGTVRHIGETAADAGRQLWLAGLGLVALAGKAVRESGHAFEVLVEEGRELEPKITSGMKKSWTGVSSTVDSMGSKVTEFGRRAEGEMEKPSRIDEAVKSYLERVGVATRDDVQQILSRLQSIETQLLDKATAPTTTTVTKSETAEEQVSHTEGSEAGQSRSKKHHRNE